MKSKGRVINAGEAKGEAFVLDIPFSFIGDFDPKTGKYEVKGQPLYGECLSGKVLVCPTGKGGTIAPFIAYEAWKIGKAPAAILCNKADPILCESALVIDIPILDSFDTDIVQSISTGQTISVSGNGLLIG